MRKVELVVKGRALLYITNKGPSGGSIRTYLQRWELNINDSVRKYYNRSDHLTGSQSNSNNRRNALIDVTPLSTMAIQAEPDNQ